MGEGTARALQAHGVAEVHAPQRMDSEGLLALPVLADVRGLRIGLVTAPGGRPDRRAVAAAGATIERADVYRAACCACLGARWPAWRIQPSRGCWP